MKLFRKLNNRGHSHILIPLIVVVLIGGIGTFVAAHSFGHAQTINSNLVTYTGGDDGCGGNATHYVAYGGHTYHVGRTKYGTGSYCKCTNNRTVPYTAVAEPPSRSNGWCTRAAYTGGNDGCGSNADHYYGSIHVGRDVTSGSVCRCYNHRTISYVAVPSASSHNSRCDTGAPAPTPTPTPTPKPGTNNKGQAILSKAQTKIGTPYVFGGGNINGPTNGGFDCSGLIMYAVYQALRVQLPHYTGSQVTTLPKVGAHVISTNGPFLPGDILFFYPAPSYDHVVIYAGSGKGLDAHDYGAPVGYYPLSANGGGHVTAAFRF